MTISKTEFIFVWRVFPAEPSIVSVPIVPASSGHWKARWQIALWTRISSPTRKLQYLRRRIISERLANVEQVALSLRKWENFVRAAILEKALLNNSPSQIRLWMADRPNRRDECEREKKLYKTARRSVSLNWKGNLKWENHFLCCRCGEKIGRAKHWLAFFSPLSNWLVFCWKGTGKAYQNLFSHYCVRIDIRCRETKKAAFLVCGKGFSILDDSSVLLCVFS